MPRLDIPKYGAKRQLVFDLIDGQYDAILFYRRPNHYKSVSDCIWMTLANRVSALKIRRAVSQLLAGTGNWALRIAVGQAKYCGSAVAILGDFRTPAFVDRCRP
jgi:hypothetical protein